MVYAAAVISTALGLLSSLGLLTLVMASTANATDAQVAVAKRWMLVIGVGAVLSLGGATLLLVWGRPWTAASVGGAPAAALFVLIAWLAATA